jgi:hypothetical protein
MKLSERGETSLHCANNATARYRADGALLFMPSRLAPRDDIAYLVER